MRLKNFEQLNENYSDISFQTPIDGYSNMNLDNSFDERFTITEDRDVDLNNLKADIKWDADLDFSKYGINDINIKITEIELEFDYDIYQGDDDLEPNESDFVNYIFNESNADFEIDFEDGKSFPFEPKYVSFSKEGDRYKIEITF